MGLTVKIDGLRELDRALAELPKATGKNVLRRVLKKRAEPIAADAAARAPVAEGPGGGDLRESIAVSTRLSARQRRQHRRMFRDDRAAVEMFVGAGPLPEAHLQEFGTAHHGPQAFLRPAWDAGWRGLLEGLKRDLWTEIRKSAARLAKKRAKAGR